MFVPLTDAIFIKAIPVLKQIESHGYEAYFVGGCVRDILLNKTINDIDIASSARPEEIEAIFPVTFDVGKEHGTIVVVIEGEPYEVTTFRTEGNYSDFRRPDEVNFVRNLREDTLRRDFTINAMAIDHQGQLFDYHGGESDLHQQIIRCVGNPLERFQEDALRMMRAIRFASQLGFQIEPQSFDAIITLKENLQHISIERSRIEFSKFLMGTFFSEKSHLLFESGLAYYLPGLNSENTKKAMELLSQEFEAISLDLRQEDLMWARLLWHLNITNAEEIRRFLKKWTHSNAFINSVIQMIQLFEYFNQDEISTWLVYRYDYNMLTLVERFYLENNWVQNASVAELYQQLPITSRKEIQVNGKDIMHILNVQKGGPKIGSLLDEIEYLIVHRKLENKYENIEKYILKQSE